MSEECQWPNHPNNIKCLTRHVPPLLKIPTSNSRSVCKREGCNWHGRKDCIYMKHLYSTESTTNKGSNKLGENK